MSLWKQVGTWERWEQTLSVSPMEQAIPLCTANGELSDWINERQLARLERLDLIQVVRHKKGHVARCILRRRPR